MPIGLVTSQGRNVVLLNWAHFIFHSFSIIFQFLLFTCLMKLGSIWLFGETMLQVVSLETYSQESSQMFESID